MNPGSIRIRAMIALHPDNAMTSAQVAEAIGVSKQQSIQNLGKTIEDGYVKNEVGEDADGKKARIYSLTALGRSRVANGNISINNKTAQQNADECETRESARRIDTIGQNGNDGLHYDPAGRIAELESDIRKQRTLLEGKNEHIASLEAEREKLLAAIDDARLQLMRGATLTHSAQLRRPLAYAHVWSNGFELFKDEDVARADIEQSFNDGAKSESLLCAVLARADLKLTWSEA